MNTKLLIAGGGVVLSVVVPVVTLSNSSDSTQAQLAQQTVLVTAQEPNGLDSAENLSPLEDNAEDSTLSNSLSDAQDLNLKREGLESSGQVADRQESSTESILSTVGTEGLSESITLKSEKSSHSEGTNDTVTTKSDSAEKSLPSKEVTRPDSQSRKDKLENSERQKQGRVSGLDSASIQTTLDKSGSLTLPTPSVTRNLNPKTPTSPKPTAKGPEIKSPRPSLPKAPAPLKTKAQAKDPALKAQTPQDQNSVSSTPTKAQLQALSTQSKNSQLKYPECKEIAKEERVGSLVACYDSRDNTKVDFVFIQSLVSLSRSRVAGSAFQIGELGMRNANTLRVVVKGLLHGNDTSSWSTLVDGNKNFSYANSNINKDRCSVEWITDSSGKKKLDWRIKCI